jgi:hypothetical protein
MPNQHIILGRLKEYRRAAEDASQALALDPQHTKSAFLSTLNANVAILFFSSGF